MIRDVGDRAGAASKASAAIGGRVLRAGDRPEAGATVMIVGDSPDHPDIAQVTGESGTYGFDGLIPGRYTLAAYARDGARGQASVSVATGETAELDIRIGERA